MRYIITGKDIKQGTIESDSPDLNEYFELGWEVTTTFIEAYHGRKKGRFTSDDTVVTATGREFLYRNLFKNVIPYNAFHPAIDAQDIKTINLISSTTLFRNKARISLLGRMRLKAHYALRYRYSYRPAFNPSDILNSDIEKKIPNSNYICICIRKRGHAKSRNLDDAYWLSLLNALAHVPCFIVGLGVESLIRNPAHKHCTLEEFCTYAASPKCLCVLGTMTGPMQLAQLVHRGKLITIDLDNHYKIGANVHPCILSDCSNFQNVPHNVYTYIPSTAELLADIEGHAGSSRIFATTRDDERFQWLIPLHKARGHHYYEFPK